MPGSRGLYRTGQDPVKSPDQMQVTLEPLHWMNMTVGSGDFDASYFPRFAGLDISNAKVMGERFICWDECPPFGRAFSLYQGVD